MSVLRNPEVMAKYSKHYIGVHADFTELQLDEDDPRHATIQRFNSRKWRPVMVFLNSAGEEVARHVGRVNSKEDALLLDRFITEKHYLKTDFKTYREAAR